MLNIVVFCDQIFDLLNLNTFAFKRQDYFEFKYFDYLISRLFIKLLLLTNNFF